MNKEELLDEQTKSLSRVQEWQIKQAQDHVRIVEILLYLIGCLTLLYTLLQSNLMQGIDLGINVCLALLYLIAGFGIRYKPILAMGIAFTVYLLIHGINFLVHPESLFTGIIIKIAIISFFCAGIFNALKIRKIRNSIE